MFYNQRVLLILRFNDATGTRMSERTIGFIKQNNNFARAPHVFVHFFPFLHDYAVKMPNFAFYGGRKQATTKFCFCFSAWIWSLEIQFWEDSPTFDKVSG